MPYITTERVKEIRNELKSKFPGFKFSVTRENHSSVNVIILSAPFNLITKEDATYETVNTFWIEDHYKDYPQIKETLLSIHGIMNSGNRTISDDGDYGAIPAFYTWLKIGDYDKPFTVNEDFKQAPEKAVITPVEVAPGSVQIIDYSEKAIAVIGDTKPIKDKLKELGGKFNFRLTCGPGWIFAKTQLEAVKAALTAQPEPVQAVKEDVKQIEDITKEAARVQQVFLQPYQQSTLKFY